MKFNQDAAMSADKPQGIFESGVYAGSLQNVKINKRDSGAIFFEFELCTEDCGTAKYLSVCTTAKNGEKTFGYNKIQALMGLLNITEVTPVGNELPVFNNRLIAIALQKEPYINFEGHEKFRMNPLSFFDPQTLQTYSEKTSGKEAKIAKRTIKDKKLRQLSNNNTQNNDKEDGLPF